jgi:hypothetical protein
MENDKEELKAGLGSFRMRYRLEVFAFPSFPLPLLAGQPTFIFAMIKSKSHCDLESVSLGVEPHLELITRYYLLFDSYCLFIVGRPLWREDGSIVRVTACINTSDIYILHVIKCMYT